MKRLAPDLPLVLLWALVSLLLATPACVGGPATPSWAVDFEEPPWTATEQRRADAAVTNGLAEVAAWAELRPKAARELGVNLVECYLDMSYGAVDPEFVERTRRRARAALIDLVTPQLQRRRDELGDDELLDLLALANYHRQLVPDEGGGVLGRLVELANVVAARPGALRASLGVDPQRVLADPQATNEDVYSLLMGAITLVEASQLPSVRLPAEALALPGRLWTYLATYPLPDAASFADRGNDWTFYDTAYLATHIGYLPTGYGRHPLRVEDAPWLHDFLRRNFQDVLDMGELDLVAEFVDLFRQYGGDETTDPMIRRGARHLLGLYDAAGGSFMAHRESYETEVPSDYDLVHKAWTGVAGLRRRVPEPVEPGSYGAAFDELVRGAGAR